MKNKITSFFKSEGWQYFEYAMLAFGGLELEIIYAYFMEPFFYGHSMKDFTTAEYIIHWSITIIFWHISYGLQQFMDKFGCMGFA